MPEWNTAAKAFIDDCTDDELADLKPRAIAALPGYTALGREALAWLNPRKAPRLGLAIYELATTGVVNGGGKVQAFLNTKPTGEPSAHRVPYVDPPDDLGDVQ